MEETILTNFNVPLCVRQRFDDVCHASGRTRTSVLVELMDDYVLNQGQMLANRAVELAKVEQSISETHRIYGIDRNLGDQTKRSRFGVHTRSESEFDLPEPMMSDGREEW